MPVFKIVPASPEHEPIDLSSSDAAAVLHTVARVNCGESDVFENGRYVFSVRLGDSGLWHISQRAEASPVVAYG